MYKDVIFTFSSYTKEGYPCIGAGTCESEMIEKTNEIFKNLENISLDLINCNNPVEIDEALNRKIAKLSPNWVKAIGISIFVKSVEDTCGGILGNPHSSSTNSEDLGNGYSVVAMPGGPGLILKGTLVECKSIFIFSTIGPNKLISKKRLKNELIRRQVETAIFVKDGSGKNGDPSILIYSDNDLKELVILNEENKP